MAPKKPLIFTIFSLTKHINVKKYNPSCHIWAIRPNQDELNLKGLICHTDGP